MGKMGPSFNIGVTGCVTGSNNVISGGTSIINGSITTGSDFVTINGRRVDLSKLDAIATPDDGGAKVPKKYRLVNSKINSIRISGSADLNLHASFYNESCNVSIAGSGDVVLPHKHFESLLVSIAGSGDVKGNGTSTQTANFSIAGSGDISKIHITGSGNLSLMGSGDIYVTADNAGNMTKNKLGSGRIRVN